MADDLLEKVRVEIAARLRELRPLVAEYEQMLAAAEALGLGAAKSTSAAPRPKARSGRTRAVGIGAGASESPGAGAGVMARERPREPRSTRAARGASVRERAPRGAAQQAIIAALEHGSHTVSELVIVTAMSGANVRDNLRRLLKAGSVTRAKRDGKAAYALSR